MEVCAKRIKIEGRLVRIARLDAEKYESLDNPLPIIEGLRQSQTRVDLFTFLQALGDDAPRHCYPWVWDNLAVLNVSTFDRWWTTQVDAKTRNMVRKADKKNVIVREEPFSDELVHGIWEIYNECPVRQGKSFPHFGKDFGTVKKEEETYLDRSIFLGAYLDNRLIGFTKLLFDDRRQQAGVLNFVSLNEHRDKAPTNALIAQAVRTCVERQIPYLVYASFAYGKKRKDTLSHFKSNNGFKRIDLPRYYVPMTLVGKAAFQFGMYKRFADILPDSVATRLRELRRAWHSRKLRSAAEISS